MTWMRSRGSGLGLCFDRFNVDLLCAYVDSIKISVQPCFCGYAVIMLSRLECELNEYNQATLPRFDEQ